MIGVLLALSAAAQVQVGDGVGALLALGDPSPHEADATRLLRARSWRLLGADDAARAWVGTIDDPDLAVAADWVRLELDPGDASVAARLLPPADVPADWRLVARLRYAAATGDRAELEVLAGEPLVASRALAALGGAHLRPLYVEHGHTPEGRRLSPPRLSPEERAQRAENLFLARDYAAAAPELERVVATGAADAAQRAALRLGTIRMRLRDDYPAAERHLRRALEGPDDDVRSHAGYRLGLTLGHLDRFDEAVAAERRVDGGYAKKAAFQVGRLLHQARRYREAAAELAAFAARKHRDKEMWAWFPGWSHFRGGDFPSARAAWADLRESTNTLVGAKVLYWTARCHLEEGDPAAARAALDELQARAPLTYYGLLGQHLAHRRFGAPPLPPRTLRLPPTPSPPAPDRAGRVRLEAGFPELVELPTVGAAWRALPYAKKRLPWEEDLAGRPRADVAAALPTAFLDLVRAAGALYDVSPWWLLPHMLQESRFRARVRSYAGALGPMQVLPRTGKRIAAIVDFPAGDFLDSALYEPGVAIHHAAWYLAGLRRELGGSVVLAAAAYNGGPLRMAEHLRRHPGLPFDALVEEIGAHETRNYARKVADHVVRYASLYAGDAEREALLRQLLPLEPVPAPRGELTF